MRLLGVLAGAAVLAGCTAAPAPDAAAPVVTTEPPAPPAACLLDTDALATASGVAWTPDETAASDTRCVYDADGGGGEFLVVEITASVPLDDVAAVCASGSRSPADGGFVCGLPGGGVFAATDRDGDLLTLAAAAVPAATTADRLATALGAQLTPPG